MHYHNVFLVNCKTKRDALELAKDFLEPYSEHLEVRRYKVHSTEQDRQRMAKHYGLDPHDLPALARKMEDWDGAEGFIDDYGLFHWSTYNSKGEWDWYQFGGRWMWCNLVEKYMDNIVKPDTNTYWNHYHDEEVKGKKWLCEFPDGTQALLDYGSEYELKGWTSDNPEWFEVKDARDPKFFEIIEHQLQTRDKSIERDKEQIAKYAAGEEDKVGMAGYYADSLEAKETRWTSDSYFWNITDDTLEFDREKIAEAPESWFLVNLDLHM